VIVLVDTDVLLDVALDRAPFVRASGELLDLLESKVAGGFLAWHSAANFFYLVRSRRGKRETRSFLLDVIEFLEIAPTTTESLRQAGRLKLRDFEDAMQVAAGLACRADVIATRNVKDYRGAPVEAVAPADVIARLR
jgi:predicted nucleic acid-binding protein